MPRIPPMRQASKPAEPATENPPQSGPKVVFTDRYGIEYLDGDTVTIHVSSDVKLTVNYNSAGLSMGLTFKSTPAKVEDAVPRAYSKLRDMMGPEIQRAEESLQNRG